MMFRGSSKNQNWKPWSRNSEIESIESIESSDGHSPHEKVGNADFFTRTNSDLRFDYLISTSALSLSQAV